MVAICGICGVEFVIAAQIHQLKPMVQIQPAPCFGIALKRRIIFPFLMIVGVGGIKRRKVFSDK